MATKTLNDETTVTVPPSVWEKKHDTFKAENKASDTEDSASNTVTVSENEVDLEKAGIGKSSPAVQLKPREFVLVMIGLAFGVFLAALDQTIVATAINKIASDFNSLDQIAWISTSYLLTTSAFLPTYGKFSDIFGRKATFLFAIFVFELGSLLCGLATDMTFMIISRAIAGLGGGGIMSLVMIIISDIVSLEDRGKYQGMIGGVFGIASVAGPLLGGAFTDHVTWRWCFYINLPFGAVTVATVWFLLHLPKPKGSMIEKLKKIDYLGVSTMALATVCLLLGLNWGGNKYAWTSPTILVLLIAGVLVYILFCYIEGWIALEPITPGRLFKIRPAVAVYTVNFFHGMAFFSMVYYVPLYFQVVRGDSATTSGLELIPFILSLVAAAIASGQIISRTDKISKQAILLVGAAFIIAGSALITLLDENSSRGKQIGLLIIPGFGIGLIIQTTVLVGQSVVKPRDVAIVTAILVFFRTLGAVLGVAIVGTIFENKLSSNLDAINGLPIPVDIIKQSSAVIQTLPPHQRELVIHAYVGALQLGYKIIIPFGGLCLIAALFVGKNRKQPAA